MEKEHKFRLILAAAFALLIFTFMFSMNTGASSMSPGEVWQTFLGSGTYQQNLILYEFRLPRMVLSVLVGMGLAVSGCVLQSVSRNALAEPGILGINAGAGLAILFFVSFIPTGVLSAAYFVPLFALTGALLASLVIYALAFKREEGIMPTRLILTGVAIQAGINAAMIVLTLRLTPERYETVALWLAGYIGTTSWDYVFALLPWLIIIFPFVYSKVNVLNILNLGDQLAIGLGTDLEKERRLLLFAAVCLSAASVSVSGSISFVGLIAPHLARQLIGGKHQYYIPVAALLGGLLVLLGDTLGRALLGSAEIPAGIVVAVIGAPYFLYLLSRSKI
jgi:iron complex transport system permease protein